MSELFTPAKVGEHFFADSVSASKRGKAFSVSSRYPKRFRARNDAQTIRVHDSNFAFYTTTLAKRNTTPFEPLSNFTYSKDIPIELGGGFVDYVTYFKIDYAGIRNTAKNIVGNNANIVPRINAGRTKESVPVFTWEIAYDLRFVELEKRKKIEISKSIQEIYQSGIRVGWDAFCQTIAYEGSGTAKGLFNSDEVVSVQTITNTPSGGETQENGFGSYRSDAAITDFFNGIFAYYLENSNRNANILPNRILVPTFVGKQLTGRRSALYTATLREFISKHNLALDESEDPTFEVKILSRPELDKAGTTQHGRIVAYRYDKKFVKRDVPYPAQHYLTLPNRDKLSYTSAFVGQVSAVQLPYNTTADEIGAVTYWDFTAGK